MDNNISFVLVMTFIGSIGSTIGGFLGSMIDTKRKNLLGASLNLTSGIMAGIVCFDMIPEGIKTSNLLFTIIWILVGVMLVLILDFTIYKLNSTSKRITRISSVLIMVSMAMHNIIEGIAVGSSFSYSYDLGIRILISIALHDIPEGLVIGITNKIDKFNLKNIIINNIIVGGVFGVGALFGKIVGNISEICVSLCISLASGVMLYIVSCNLLPDSNRFIHNKFFYIFYIVGIIFSLIILFN